MDINHTYWEEVPNIQHVKYENNLNFATAPCSEDDTDYGPYKKCKVSRQDPMSHRIIEKRRRDRMNNCLADLSRLIPAEYLKKGRGRVEKTEIIEMAIKHMKKLQQDVVCPTDHYRLGYQECMSETMRFMVEVEGHFPREAICVRLLNHLQQHCETLCRTNPIGHHNTTVPLPNRESLNENGEQRINEYVTTPKIEPNNNLLSHVDRPRDRDCVDIENCEKHSETYKYKTDIKLRFNQDLNAIQKNVKRQKIDGGGRRNSINSFENHSSTHSSPPSSELCTRISSECENVNRVSPTGSSVSQNNLTRSESMSCRTSSYSNHMKNNLNPSSSPTLDIKTNFSVPIFVLHAKGSFYVPLTIDYTALLPYLNNYDLLEVGNINNNNNNNNNSNNNNGLQSVVLHPVTINVNFQPTIFKNQKHDYQIKWN